MFKKIFLISAISLLSGCMFNDLNHEAAPVDSVNIGNALASPNENNKNFFPLNYDKIILKNSLKENISILRKLESNKHFIFEINKNKFEDAPRHHDYYIYTFLQNKIIKDIKIKNNSSEKDLKKIHLNEEIDFLLNACKTSSQDIAHHLQNLAQENPMHFKTLSKESYLLISECLNKKISNTLVVKKDNLKNEKILKENNIPKDNLIINQKLKAKEHLKMESFESENPLKKVVYKKNIIEKNIHNKENDIVEEIEKDKFKLDNLDITFDKIKGDLDNEFFIIKAHCNEEDSYLLPNDIQDFKNKIKYFSNGNVKLEIYAYKNYNDQIESCYSIYLENKILLKKDKEEIVIEKQDFVNVKTLEIVKSKGYTGYNFKDNIDSVISKIFKNESDVESILKQNSSLVRKIEKNDLYIFIEVTEYNESKYFVFLNKENKTQFYYPLSDDYDFFVGDKLNHVLYYSIFDYGYINDYRTIILNSVKI